MNAWTWLRSEWDRVAGFALVALGAGAVFVGYLGVRNSPYVAEGLAYIASGGVGGLFLLGLGVALLMSADLHDEWSKLDRIEATLRGEPLLDAGELFVLLRGQGVAHDETTAAGRSVPTPRPAAAESVTMASAVTRRSVRQAGTNGARALALASGAEGFGVGAPLAMGLLLVPTAVLALGWRRTSQTGDMSSALSGLGTAAAGLVIGLAVLGLSIVWLRFRVVRRQEGVLGLYLLRDRLLRYRPAGTAVANASGETPAGAEVLVVPGLDRYHLPGCPALRGLEARAVARRELDATRAPCELCGAG